MEEHRTTGGPKPQGGNHLSGGPRSHQRPPAQGGGYSAQGAAEQLYDKAKEATDYVADRASDLWDDTYDQGRRYYREGSRAMGDIDGGTVATALVAAALGYALAYLIHAQSISRRVPDYARVRGDYGRDYRGHSQR